MRWLVQGVLGLILCDGMAYASDQQQSFLVISDMHVNTSISHAMDFAPHRITSLNDLDVTTYKKLIKELALAIQLKTIARPKFIVLLGDMVGHYRVTLDAALSSETIVFKTLKDAFPDVPIIYVFGNNDSFSGNYGPFESETYNGRVQSPKRVMSALWNTTGSLSTGRLCAANNIRFPCVLTQTPEHGYYALYLAPKLRALSLDSVMFSTHYKGEKKKAQKQQLQWLAEQLNSAHLNQESVLMFMHIPPGKNVYDDAWFGSHALFWDESILQEFLSLIAKYHSDIIGVLSAHTHKDELKIIRDPQGQPLVGVYLNAALSTSHGNAPSVRSYVLALSEEHWRLDNYFVYYFKKDKSEVISLHLLYNYRDIYCSPLEPSINDCLGHVTVDTLERYFSAGNKNYVEKFILPEHRYMTTYP